MKNKRYSLQRGALQFSLAVVIAGMITAGTLIKTEFSKIFSAFNTAPAATVQTQATTPDQTSVAFPQPTNTNIGTPSTSATTSTDASAPSATTTATQTPAVTATSVITETGKDCGTDMTCFIAQAKACGPATVEFSNTVNVNTLNITATSNLSIDKTTKPGTCGFVSRLDNVKPAGASVVGAEQICAAIPATKLITILTSWNKGTFNSNDLSQYSCTMTSPISTGPNS